MDYFEEIVRRIVSGEIKDSEQLQSVKKELAMQLGLNNFPTNADILMKAGEHRKQVIDMLQKKPSRTMSGIAAVAVMTPPQKCPHGKCVYCPGGVEIHTPQSYTGEEPAAMRGKQYEYNAFTQAFSRLQQLEMIGHYSDKIELIVMGGTFTCRPLKEQQEFIKGCFEGMNGQQSETIERAIEANETSKHRCIGLTVETRPDCCGKKEINNILNYGATRVELGVQHPDDEIYSLVKRGHSVKDVVDATQLLKDSGLKICYHLMPNLPGSTPAKDLKMFKDIFTNPDYMPDMIKIYPTLLINPDYGKTELQKMYEKGDWKPYTEAKMVEMLAKAKSEFPKWVRVMRIQRDIPSPLVAEGIKHSNLRQLVKDKMKEDKLECNCIRCREVGKKETINPEINIEKYTASKGTEYFISFEDKNSMVGFIRLRDPAEPFKEEITPDSALVRELHVYGPMVAISEKPKTESQQHRGFGTRLLLEAERIAKEELDAKKLLVTSGVGVRDYYKKRDYKLDGPYMSKIF